MRARFAYLPLIAGLLLATHDLAAVEFSDIYAWIGNRRGAQPQNTGLTIFPTLIIPSGGEFEGMATAYTAVARDVSFLDANAAASATLRTTRAISIVARPSLAATGERNVWGLTPNVTLARRSGIPASSGR